MNNSPLEMLAARYGNKVLYDASGNPSIFCQYPAQNSNYFDDALPDHLHPAFKVNGEEDSALLIGKYMASELTTNGTLYSLPNMPPRVSLGHDPIQTRMRAFGGKVSGLTIADHGLLVLMAHKYGYTPHGNNAWGADYRDANAWDSGKAYTVNTVVSFRGWKYKCLIAHTSALDLLPVDHPAHWEKQDFIGGTPVESQCLTTNDSHGRGYNTLTGTGPLDWYLDGTPGSLADIQGNAYEQVYGFRLVNCEIQIIPDNNAADPACDTSASSAAWRAILPHASDNGYDLVEPGTAGTVHYAWLNNKVTLVARELTEEEFDGQYRNTAFKDMAVDSATLPYVPTILQELGLAPIPGMTVQGHFYVQMTKDERVARRGGSCNSTSFAGVAYLSCSYSRGGANVAFGARPRSRV